MLRGLVEQLVGARILLLLTYRPGYRPPWIEKSYASQLALARLAPRHSRRLVQAVLSTTPVPTTIQAVLATRIDRLPLEAKRLLQMAAVIGKDVAVTLLEAIAGLPEAVLQ